MSLFTQRRGLSLFGVVVGLALLFVFSRDEFMIDLGLTRSDAPLLRETIPPMTTASPTTTTTAPPMTPPYYTSPNHSILSLAQSRFASEITDSMFKAKQQVLDSLCVGEFKGDLSANQFQHASPQARALYAKWSSQSKTQECVANRRMYLVGTSFQRSILWSLLRWLMGGLEQIPPEYKVISSVPALVREKDARTGECDPNVNGTKYDVQPLSWHTAVPSCMLVRSEMCENAGPAGFQLEPCGLPMSAKWKQPGTDTTVLYQFKTYINAPAVDEHVFATINATKWDVLWLASGEWGTWGSQNAAYQESLDFLRRAANTFPGWIVVSGNSAHRSETALFLAAARSLTQEHGARILVFDQQPLAQAASTQRVKQDHGYYGAATDVMVRVFLALVCDEGGWGEH